MGTVAVWTRRGKGNTGRGWCISDSGSRDRGWADCLRRWGGKRGQTETQVIWAGAAAAWTWWAGVEGSSRRQSGANWHLDPYEIRSSLIHFPDEVTGRSRYSKDFEQGWGSSYPSWQNPLAPGEADSVFTGVGLGENIPAGLSLGERHSRTGM